MAHKRTRLHTSPGTNHLICIASICLFSTPARFPIGASIVAPSALRIEGEPLYQLSQSLAASLEDGK